MFMPFSFAMFNNAWTEPFVVMTLALVIFLAVRGSRWLPFAFGLFLSSKQYCVLSLPLSILLLPQPVTFKYALSFYLKAFAVVAAINLPFFIWSPYDFWADVVVAQVIQPYRGDSLSFMVPMVNAFHVVPSSVWGFLAAVPVAFLLLWRAPRTPYGFTWSMAVMYVVFFAFSKQAFANYYYLVIGALFIAVSAMGLESGRGLMSGDTQVKEESL